MSDDSSGAVALGPRIVASGGFDRLYKDGMRLIEDVAAYLDGAGRTESRAMPREASFAYATESMRLTTRLMQLASWLLLQRAVNEGEITSDNAHTEKAKVKFSATPTERGGPGFDEIPKALRDFIAEGDRLFERVMQFDTLERGRMPEIDPGLRNSITDQFARLKAAFGRG